MHPNLFCRLFSLSQQWRWIMISIIFGYNNFLIILFTARWIMILIKSESKSRLFIIIIFDLSLRWGKLMKPDCFRNSSNFVRKKDYCLPYLDFLYGPVFFIQVLLSSTIEPRLNDLLYIVFSSWPHQVLQKQESKWHLGMYSQQNGPDEFFSCGTLTAIMIRIISRPFWRLR